MLLEIKNLTFRYRDQPVLDGLSLNIRKNELLVLMGPNGAGKSTVLKLIAGMLKPERGSFAWLGQKFIPRPDALPRLGIAYVMQGARVFPTLSVRDNILIGGASLPRSSRLRRLDEATEFFPELKSHLKRPAGSLSGGEQQMCSLARALMTQPKLLLLDEPTVGLAPRLISQTLERVARIKDELGASVVVVEHNLKTLLLIADRGIVLSDGKILLEGQGQDLKNSSLIEKAFFGQ